MDVEIQTQLPEMAGGMDVSPAELDTRELLPVLLPASFFAIGKWCGPFTRLRAGEIGLTWAVLIPGGSLRYVNRAIQAHWEEQGLDWKALAMANLARHTEHQPGPRMLRRVNGQVFAVAFLYEDGLGPSRLLFRGTLSRFFPKGCRIAIPERSCGFAFGTDLNAEERSQVEGVINHCYQHGTRPFAPGSYAVDDLQPE
jgi:hypothetical protein